MPQSTNYQQRVVIIGAGFCGLSAGLEFAKAGWRVTILERDAEIGGLAGSFVVGGQRLEKFYHHWFASDRHIASLIEELGLQGNMVYRASSTGSYYANSLFRLTKPTDVLFYKPLSILGRFRLGFLVFQAMAVRDWKSLEQQTAEQWLRRKCGSEVFERVWMPLLKGKFGAAASEISAVWIWNKLALRGGSRGKKGEEILAYYKGGFASLADSIANRIRDLGGQIRTASEVDEMTARNGRITGVSTAGSDIEADLVVCAAPIPEYVRLLTPHVAPSVLLPLRKIRYLGNVCLTLELDRSLSDTYWINVVDPSFPFVGVIEHTNFEPASSYAGRRIVYLSKYLPTEDHLYQTTDEELYNFSLPYLKKIFPEFDESWVLDYHVYREPYSQPIVTRQYSALIPPARGPLAGLYLASMAQIYPEDRGTNYAVRQGREVAAQCIAEQRERPKEKSC